MIENQEPFTGFICVPVDGKPSIVLFHHDAQGFDPSRVGFRHPITDDNVQNGSMKSIPFAERDTNYLAKHYVDGRGYTTRGLTYLGEKHGGIALGQYFLQNRDNRSAFCVIIQHDDNPSYNDPPGDKVKVKVEWCGKVTVEGSEDIASGNYYHHDVKGFNPSRLKIKGKPVDSSFIKKLKTLPLIVPNPNVTEPALQFTDQGLAYARARKKSSTEFLGFVAFAKSDGKTTLVYHYDPKGYDKDRFVTEAAVVARLTPADCLAIRCDPVDLVHTAQHYEFYNQKSTLAHFLAIGLSDSKELLISLKNQDDKEVMKFRSRCVQELAGVEPQDWTYQRPQGCTLEVSENGTTAKRLYFHYDEVLLNTTRLTFKGMPIVGQNEVTLLSLYMNVNAPDPKSETLRTTDQGKKDYYEDRLIKFQPPGKDKTWMGFVWVYSERLKLYVFHVNDKPVKEGVPSKMTIKLPRSFNLENPDCIPFGKLDNQNIQSRTFDISNEAFHFLKERYPEKTKLWKKDEKIFGSQCRALVAEALGVEEEDLYKDNYEFVGDLHVQTKGETNLDRIFHWDVNGYNPKFTIMNGTQIEAGNVVMLSLLPCPKHMPASGATTEQGEMLYRSGLKNLHELVGRERRGTEFFGMLRVLVEGKPDKSYSVMHYDPKDFRPEMLNGKMSTFSKDGKASKSASFHFNVKMTLLDHLLRNPGNFELSDAGRAYVNASTNNGLSLYEAALNANGKVRDLNLDNRLLKLVVRALDPKRTIDVDPQVTRSHIQTPWRGYIRVKIRENSKDYSRCFHVGTDAGTNPFEATILTDKPYKFKDMEWDPDFVPQLSDLQDDRFSLTDQALEQVIDDLKIDRDDERIKRRFRRSPPLAEKKDDTSKQVEQVPKETIKPEPQSTSQNELSKNARKKLKRKEKPQTGPLGQAIVKTAVEIGLDRVLEDKDEKRIVLAKHGAQQKKLKEQRKADAAAQKSVIVGSWSLRARDEAGEVYITPTFEEEAPKEKIRESTVHHEKSYSGVDGFFHGFLTTMTDDGSFLDFFHHSATGYKPEDGFTFNGKQVDGFRILHLVRDVDPMEVINTNRAYFTDEGSVHLLGHLAKHNEELTPSKVGPFYGMIVCFFKVRDEDMPLERAIFYHGNPDGYNPAKFEAHAQRDDKVVHSYYIVSTVETTGFAFTGTFEVTPRASNNE